MTKTLSNLYDWSSDEEKTNVGLLNAVTLIGSFLATVNATQWINRLGRLKLTIVCNLTFMTVSGAICMIQSLPALFIGRFIMGYGSSLLVYVSPPFLREISPTCLRGLIGSFHQLQYAIATVIGYAVGLGLPEPSDGETNGYWRVVLGFPTLVSLLQASLLVLFFRKYESPKFLFVTDKKEAAHDVLASLQRPDEAKASYLALEATRVKGKTLTWRDLKEPYYRKPLLLAMLFPAVLHGNGIGSILIYSTDIFSDNTEDQPLEDSIMDSILYVGVTFVASVFVGQVLITRFKRRTCAIWSIGGDVFAATLVALSADGNGFIDLKFAVVIFMFVFGIGFGVVIFPYIAEIIEAELLIYTRYVHWSMLIIISLVTKPAIDAIGLSGLFYIYAGLNFVYALLFWKYMVETSGLDAKQIRDKFT